MQKVGELALQRAHLRGGAWERPHAHEEELLARIPQVQPAEQMQLFLLSCFRSVFCKT